ncbi:MAG: GDSL-type esterase/lipase family protein [Bacilli bacterium]|nr:GDSL-type esterase/lipase family protein [Bacilli bacterium]
MKYNALIIGDSLLKGVVCNANNQRYSVLEESCVDLVTRDLNASVDNKSRFGQTTDKALKMLEKILPEYSDYQYAIIEMGGNDSDFNWVEVSNSPETEHDPKVCLENFADNIRKMIDLIKSYNIVPIIFSLPPISPERYLNWISKGLSKDNILIWLKDVSIIYRHQELYNMKLMEIANITNTKIYNLRSGFLQEKDYEKYLCVDGIHLNELGHQKLKEMFEEQYHIL